VFYIFVKIVKNDDDDDEDDDDEDNKNHLYIKPLCFTGSEIVQLSTTQISRYLDNYLVKDNISSYIDCIITKITKC